MRPVRQGLKPDFLRWIACAGGIQRSSVDYYASLRSLYRQLRDTEIRNGRPAAAKDLPEF